MPLFGLAFFDQAEIEPTAQSQRSTLQAVSEAGLCGGDGTICWLRGFGEIKVFRVRVTDDASEYWAASLREMTERERETQAKSAWRIEMYHRALKQQCFIERAQVRRRRPVINHIRLCIRAFVRLESHCYRENISWMQAKTSIIRDAVRAYLADGFIATSKNCYGRKIIFLLIQIFSLFLSHNRSTLSHK